MSEKLENILITSLAPTILKKKPASLISIDKTDKATLRELKSEIKALNLSLDILKIGQRKKLIFIYNYHLIEKIILNNFFFLTRAGFKSRDTFNLISELKERLKCGFPHEIGLLLGYPKRDVYGFINKQEVKAQALFKSFNTKKQSEKTYKKYKTAKTILKMGLECGMNLTEIIKRRELL